MRRHASGRALWHCGYAPLRGEARAVVLAAAYAGLPGHVVRLLAVRRHVGQLSVRSPFIPLGGASDACAPPAH